MPRIGERGWIHSGVKVYDNTAAPTTWTDLDLSAVVGKSRALVFVKIKNRGFLVHVNHHIRIKGETEEVAGDSTKPGMNNQVVIHVGHIAHFAMETNENGKIQWKADSEELTDMWVLGYIR